MTASRQSGASKIREILILRKASLLFALLFAVWLVLSGMFSKGYVAFGIFSCCIAVLLYWLLHKDKAPIPALKILAMFSYCAWLIKEIVTSSVNISLKMWQLEPDISPQAEWIPHNLGNDTQIAIFANSITLTPGTVTIGTGEGGLYVHSLTEDSMESLKQGKMLGRVNKLTGEGV